MNIEKPGMQAQITQFKQLFIQTCIFSMRMFQEFVNQYAQVWGPLQNVDNNTDTGFYTQNIQLAPEQYSMECFQWTLEYF